MLCCNALRCHVYHLPDPLDCWLSEPHTCVLFCSLLFCTPVPLPTSGLLPATHATLPPALHIGPHFLVILSSVAGAENSPGRRTAGGAYMQLVCRACGGVHSREGRVGGRGRGVVSHKQRFASNRENVTRKLSRPDANPEVRCKSLAGHRKGGGCCRLPVDWLAGLLQREENLAAVGTAELIERLHALSWCRLNAPGKHGKLGGLGERWVDGYSPTTRICLLCPHAGAAGCAACCFLRYR